ILPQARRAESFVVETKRQGPTFCVWNCPRREEVGTPPTQRSGRDDKVIFYYHGSLNRVRLPLTILDALRLVPLIAQLKVVGYESMSSRGYMAMFMAHAHALGLRERVTYLGALSRRSDLIAAATTADVGLAFMPRDTDDINMRHMAGASNKPFDYLAA